MIYSCTEAVWNVFLPWPECSLLLHLIAMLWNSLAQLSKMILKSNIVVRTGHALELFAEHMNEVFGCLTPHSDCESMFMMGLPWLLVLELVLYAGCFICGVIAAAWMTLTQVTLINHLHNVWSLLFYKHWKCKMIYY